MCGIAGILELRKEARVNPAELRRMCDVMSHRGPDDEGIHTDGGLGIGMRRLSIVDLATGHQPISNENGSIRIVFNGEIYNHLSLREQLITRGHAYRTHSDTETIVHLYEEYGRDCVKHLRGMFAFAIWDENKKVLFIARDRLGIKPLYYHFSRERFLFGSEIKVVLAHANALAQFNSGVLPEFLAFGYLSGDETFYNGIRKLLPGHTLELTLEGELEIRQYWNLDASLVHDSLDEQYYVRSYRELLEGAVESHLMSDVPVGVFLSGGVDSSAVAALMTKIRREPVETFSVGYGEHAYSELPFARTVANHLKSVHHEILVNEQDFFNALPLLIWHEDEPIVWPSSVSLYFVARLARERVSVVLTGEGSDETLGGYTRYPWTLLHSRVDSVYRKLTPPALRDLLLKMTNSGPLSATTKRRLEHTFLARDGASWPSFYFDNFYSAFSGSEQDELLTPEAMRSAGDAYAGSMSYWDHSSGDLLRRLLYSDIKT